MALALTTQAVERTFRKKKLYLIATPSGNYVAGGDTVNLTAIAPSIGQSDATVGYPGNIKSYSVVSAPAGYTATLIPGATLATWKLKVMQTGAALSGPFAELAAAAYPAGVLAGTFVLMVEGPKGQI